MKLKLNKIYEYYDVPLVFSTYDANDNDYICLLITNVSEETLRYICVPFPVKNPDDVHFDLRDTIENAKIRYEIIVNDDSELFEAEEMQDYSVDILPDKEFFIEY
jgi:hypothetical protein